MKFYKETEFKDSKEIGKIPKDWKIAKLSEVTKKIKDIDHKMPKKREEGIPFVSIRYMLKFPDFAFKIDFNDSDLEYISEEDYKYHVQRFNAEKGDILYSRFGSIGYAKLIITEQPFIASYSIVLVKPDKSKVYSDFLLCALNSERTRNQARLQTKGATNRNLHLKDIQNLIISIPPMPEQRLIAEVLSCVDLAIEKVDEAIARVERLKKGLMQQLLTKGIGHKEFKETPIGKTPKDWEIVRITNLVNVVKGFAFSSKFFNSQKKGMPLIRIRDLGKNETEAYYSGPYDEVYIVKKGDILISMDGEFNAYIWYGPVALLNQRVCKIWSRDPSKLNDLFLYYQIQKPLKTIEQQVSQTTVKHLLDRHMERIIIPLPSLSEQQKIGEVLSSIEYVLRLKKRKKEKLVKMKKKLMDLLLTGKVRVSA